MVLKIDIHRYAASDAIVLSLKKQRNKQANERLFKLFKIFWLIITSLYLIIFLNGQLQMFVITVSEIVKKEKVKNGGLVRTSPS